LSCQVPACIKYLRTKINFENIFVVVHRPMVIMVVFVEPIQITGNKS
jgi:hypothetical protein